MVTFEWWVCMAFLPFVENKDGVKFLFGDNLASRFIDSVIQLAKGTQHSLCDAPIKYHASHAATRCGFFFIEKIVEVGAR